MSLIEDKAERYKKAELPEFIVSALGLAVKQFAFENSLLKGAEVEDLAFFSNELAQEIQVAMIDFFINKKDVSNDELAAHSLSDRFKYSHFPNYIKLAMCRNLEKMSNTKLYNENQLELMSQFSELVVFNMEMAQIENRKSQ